MAATTQRTRRLTRTLAGALIGMIGLVAQSIPIHAQTSAPPAPGANPITLFHDDFTTEADRWRLLDLGQKASVGYDINAGTLNVAVGAAGYALWSTPDTDLTLDQADVRIQADWSAGGSDSQFGLVLDYRSDNDMLIVAVSRDGHVRIGHYRTNVWTDITPPVSVTFDPTQPVTIRAMLVTIKNTHRLATFVDGQFAQSITLTDFKAGKFGFFARNGASGATALSLHNFTVGGLANSETF
jgi:hypothetical protein